MKMREVLVRFNSILTRLKLDGSPEVIPMYSYEMPLRLTGLGMFLIGKEERIVELVPTARSAFQVLEGILIY